MPADQTDLLLHSIFDKVFNQGYYDVVDELLAAGSIAHTPAWGLPNNRTGFKQFAAGLRTAFPDLHYELEDEIRQGDKIAAHWTMRGTHKGPFQGSQPTGRLVEVQGIIFARVVDGQMAEYWALIDQMGFLQQLGIVPPPIG